MNVSDELLMAYVDDELDATTRARIEAAVAADPLLATRVAQQRALRDRLRNAFDGALNEPVPERLLALGNVAPSVRNVAAPTERARPRSRAPAWFALAASLVVGVLIGQRLDFGPGSAAPIVVRGSGPVARGILAAALTKQLASEQGPGDNVQIGLSFRARTGEYCRTFSVRDGRVSAGVACRAGNEWQVRLLESTAPVPGSSGSMRQAGTTIPDSVRQAVESRIDGEPLDRTQEARARAAGWERTR
jgi:hypothetical protein